MDEAADGDPDALPEYMPSVGESSYRSPYTRDSLADTAAFEPEDAVFRTSQAFFATLGIRLDITDGAARKISEEAARHARIGARALKSVYGKMIKPFEYDPYGNSDVVREGDGYRLTINEEIVNRSLKPAYEQLT